MKSTKFCVIGRGSIGTRHIKNLKSLSYNNIIAFSQSRDHIKSEYFEKEYSVKTFSSWEQIKGQNPDIFIIANPTSKHIPFAEIALDMNCHIFMEKPLSHTLDNVKTIQKKVEEKRRVFFLANNLRFHPAILKAKKMLDSCRLGDIFFARLMVGQYLPDWHPRENYRKSYAGKKSCGGGVVLTLHHEIDYAYWLFGKFKEIKALVRKVGSLEIDVEDTAAIIIETEKQGLVEIHLDYIQRPAKRTFHIQGSKGSLHYTFGESHLTFYDFDRQKEETVWNIKGYDNNCMYIDEMEYFLQCVHEGKVPESGLKSGEYTLEASLEILRQGAEDN